MSEENIAAVPSKRLKKVAVDTMPAQVTLTAPFGYYDEVSGGLGHKCNREWIKSLNPAVTSLSILTIRAVL